MSGFKVNFSVNNQLATPSIHAAPFAQRPAAGQPGRVFIDTDSPSTGIYRDTGIAWIQIAGTGGGGGGTLQTVTDAGNTTTNDVAIGTSGAPSAPLDVHGAGVVAILQATGTNDSFLQFNKSGNGKFKIGNVHNSGNDYFSVYNLQENSDAILVNISTNNVAIGGGTVAPSYRLDISGSLRNTGNAYFGTSSGNVGIGTDTLDTFANYTSLTIKGTSGSYISFRSSTSQVFRLENNGTGLGIDLKVVTNSPLIFSTNNTERGRFQTTGNFSIGTTTDAGFKLDVNGTARVQGNVTTTSSFITPNSFTAGGSFGVRTNSIAIGDGTESVDNQIRYSSGGVASFNFFQTGGGSASISVGGGAGTCRMEFSALSGYLLRSNNVEVLRIINEITFNEVGSNIDFRIEGDTNANLFFLDASVDNIGMGTNTPNASALLDISSTTKGFLPPRMTGAQAEAIATPAAGLMVYANNGNGTTITTTGWWGYDGAAWVKLN